MNQKENKPKIIIVIGATASGKSTVAHQICKQFNGEIINADVMQCYKGAQIGTNKPTEEEKKEFHYHLVDFVDPSINYTVQQWVDACDKEIEQIINNNHIPVVCGETSFYVDSLLFRHSSEMNMNSNDGNENDIDEEREKDENEIQLPWNQNEWYHQLELIDKPMATKLHPNDLIRIKNALLYYLKHKKPLSEALLNDEIIIKYNPIIVWVDCDVELLDKRAEIRVGQMIKEGMTEQNLTFLKENEEHMKQLEWKWGICMAIGLREYIPLFKKECTEEDVKNAIITHTKQYIRKQIRWIKNRVIDTRKCICIHHVHDGKTILELENVYKQIETYLQSPNYYFQQGVTDDEIKESKENEVDNKLLEKKNLIEWKKYSCETCGKILNGENEWNIHLKSKGHKAKKKQLKKMNEQQNRKYIDSNEIQNNDKND